RLPAVRALPVSLACPTSPIFRLPAGLERQPPAEGDGRQHRDRYRPTVPADPDERARASSFGSPRRRYDAISIHCMTDTIITINPGSATTKIGVFAHECGRARPLGRATLDEAAGVLHVRAGEARTEHVLPDAPAPVVIESALVHLGELFAMGAPRAIGQRVVHGGDRFTGPALIAGDVLPAIQALVPLAPLHQPKSVALIRMLAELYPDVAQIACFDTAFHRTQPDIVRRFAIPRALFDSGVKRFGFHGLSYQFISHELSRQRPDIADGRVIVAHLGSGASLCALKAGISCD